MLNPLTRIEKPANMDQGVVLQRVFVGGGQDYWGPTSERDRLVVQQTARELFSLCGNSVEIVTGGMPGIPQDFGEAWIKAGGKHVLCVLSTQAEQNFLLGGYPFKHIVVCTTQRDRRLALVKLPRIVCALFVQGGKYTTHELQLFGEAGIPIVSFWGSGGASGGGQPYDGWAYSRDPLADPLLAATDPEADTEPIARALAAAVHKQITQQK
jgi:hypothetical protein